MTATREMVVAEARSWIRTPYLSRQMVKGAGIDCGLLIYAVYTSLGLMPEIEVPRYAQDWWAHTTQEMYLRIIEKWMRKVMEGVVYPELAKAEPGNVALTRSGSSKVFNHAGIVTRWPMLVHALSPVTYEVDASVHPIWIHHEVLIFDPWEKPE